MRVIEDIMEELSKSEKVAALKRIRRFGSDPGPRVATRKRGKDWKVWQTAFLVGYQYGLDLVPQLFEFPIKPQIDELSRQSFEDFLASRRVVA